MKTNLTIDDDLAEILHRKSEELSLPFNELVNSTLRKGLSEDFWEAPHKITVRPHDFGAAIASLNLDGLNLLVDDLAVSDYLLKSAKDGLAKP